MEKCKNIIREKTRASRKRNLLETKKRNSVRIRDNSNIKNERIPKMGRIDEKTISPI